jgi:HK97 family phage major capsid protein
MELEVKDQLAALHAELKGYFEKAAEEKKVHGETLAETKTAIDTIQKKLDDQQKQLDGIDLKVNAEKFADGGPVAHSLGELVIDSPVFKEAKAADMIALRMKEGRIRVPLTELFAGRKAITTVGIGTGTTGVQMPFRLPNITELPRVELRIRDLMTVQRMTSGNSFDYVKQLERTNLASPVSETVRKPESTYTWTSASGTVKTIAHFTKASRQAIDDIPWLRNAIDTELMYGLLVREESEILNGDGLGQHLDGIIHQATAYNTALNVANDTKLDKLRHAKLQARLAGLATFAPDGIVLNPRDMHDIELIKSDEGTTANRGLYVLGDPRGGASIKTVWGLPVVESDAVSYGQFVVGAFATGATLIDRMAAMVAISYENEADFVENLVTILCEERLGLAVRRPDSFIVGTF